MAERQRYLSMRAGPFRVALPLSAVRQIVDVGGNVEPTALAGRAHSLARLLGSIPTQRRPALLLIESSAGAPVVVSTCVLGDVVDTDAPPVPLPRTVACKWPRLIRGVIHDHGLRLVLEPSVLLGLVEAAGKP